MKRLKTWKLADWLHDIEAAKVAVESAKKGDYGPPSEELDRLIKAGPREAIVISLSGRLDGPRACIKRTYTEDSPISIATVDHACLDEKGYKRSQ
jgi:hypothetical protein